MPRYAIYMPFSFDAEDDQTAALVANLIAHRNALLLTEDGRVVETLDTPVPDRLLSPEDLRVRGQEVVAAIDTIAAGHTGERAELDREVEVALASTPLGPWSREDLVHRVYHRWMSDRSNPVTILVHRQVDLLVSRLRTLIADRPQVSRV